MYISFSVLYFLSIERRITECVRDRSGRQVAGWRAALERGSDQRKLYGAVEMPPRSFLTTSG